MADDVQHADRGAVDSVPNDGSVNRSAQEGSGRGDWGAIRPTALAEAQWLTIASVTSDAVR